MSQSVEDNAKPEGEGGGGALFPRTKLLHEIIKNYSLCFFYLGN